MTPEQKRIAIAEACGLQVIDVPFIPSQTKAAGCVFTDAARTEWRRCYPNSCGVYGIPDYLNDLNAMHAAEKVLNGYRRTEYIVALRKIIVRDMDTQPHQDPDTGTLLDIYFYGATAAQRAEAFLRTLGLWTE